MCTRPPARPYHQPAPWLPGSTLESVTDLHVQIPDDVAVRVATEARDRGVTPDEVVAEALRAHVPVKTTGALGFIGIGQAKSGFSARAAEQRMEVEGFV